MSRFLTIGVMVCLFAIAGYWLLGKRTSPASANLRFVSLAWQEQAIAANKSIVAEWNNAHPEKRVEYVQGTWSAAHDYLITAFETGDVPDIFHFESSVIIDYAVRGYLADLRPFIDPEMKEDILDVAWSTVTRTNGEIGGIPFLIESLVVIYNKTAFELEGIAPPTFDQPWSWSDVCAAARRLTRDTDGDGTVDQYGAAMGLRNSANIIMNTSLSFGGSFFHKEGGQFVVKVGSEEQELLKTIVEMLYVDNTLSPSSIGATGTEMIPGFLSGRYAMLIGIGAWARQQLVQNAPKSFRWGVMPPLKAKTQAFGVSTQTLSVPKLSRRHDDAMAFISFMLNSRNMARLALSDWMVPARKSCLVAPAFRDSIGGWDVTCGSVPLLATGPWQGVPGYVEWKSRVANPVLQELFAGRLTVDEAAARIEREGNAVLQRYKQRGEIW